MTNVATRTAKRAGSTSSSSPTSPAREVELKVICVGAAATGKTTFLKYWEKRDSAQAVKTTIGMELHKHEMDVYLPAPDVAPSVSTFLPPQQTPTDDLAASSSSSTFTQNQSGLFVREGSQVVGNSETKRNGLAPYRLTVPTTRTDYGPGTECRSAIVKIWDIQGQEHSKTMTRGFYSGAICALIFCDLTSHTDSLEGAVLWKLDVDNKVRVIKLDGSGEHSIPCWLVVNKYDLIKDAPIGSCPPWATRQMLDQFVVKHNFVGWSYASGLRGTNVVETVSAALSRTAERFPEEIRNVASDPPATGGVLLHRPRRPEKKTSDCC